MFGKSKPPVESVLASRLRNIAERAPAGAVEKMAPRSKDRPQEIESASLACLHLLEGFARSDFANSILVDAYWPEVTALAAHPSPGVQAALNRFIDGDELGALYVLDDLRQARSRGQLAAGALMGAMEEAEVDRLRREMERRQAQ